MSNEQIGKSIVPEEKGKIKSHVIWVSNHFATKLEDEFCFSDAFSEYFMEKVVKYIHQRSNDFDGTKFTMFKNNNHWNESFFNDSNPTDFQKMWFDFVFSEQEKIATIVKIVTLPPSFEPQKQHMIPASPLFTETQKRFPKLADKFKVFFVSSTRNETEINQQIKQLLSSLQ